MGSSAAGRSTPPASPRLAAGKPHRAGPGHPPAVPGNPRTPGLHHPCQRPRRPDGRGEPHRLAAAFGDHNPGGRRPMLRERLGWRRGLCHGPQTSRVILMKVGPKYGKDDPRWHLAHSDAVGRCRQIGTRMWASAHTPRSAPSDRLEGRRRPHRASFLACVREVSMRRVRPMHGVAAVLAPRPGSFCRQLACHRLEMPGRPSHARAGCSWPDWS